jgi:leucyl/phenylalanyl-tRNA--protein transferase
MDLSKSVRFIPKPRFAASMMPLAGSRFFPPPTAARRDGLLLVGGRLHSAWLLDAYQHGIFPWPCGDTLAWWSPDPRAVLELDALYISKRLARTVRRGVFTATCNRAFEGVITGCATADDRRHGTWITPSLKRAYCKLYQLGYAHSVEIWHDGRLAGGAYGVAIGGLFAAESMFHYVTDASKVALVYLTRHLKSRGYVLMDIQQLTPHMQSLGAIEIPRSDYLRRLTHARSLAVSFGDALESPL